MHVWLSLLVSLLLAGFALAQDSPESPSTNESVEANSWSPFSSYLAGYVAAADGDVEAAARFFGSALDQAADLDPLLAPAMLAFVNNGEVERALPLALRLRERERHLPAEILLVVNAAREGDFANAQETLDLIQADRGIGLYLLPVFRAWLALGRGDASEAMKGLDRFSERGVLAPVYDYHAGLILELLGARAEAASYFDRVAGIQELSGRVALATANYFRTSDQPQREAGILDRFAELHPGSGLGLAIREGSLPLEYANVTSPNHGLAEAMYDAARLLFNERLYPGAVQYARFALYLRPDFPSAQFTLAAALRALGSVDPVLAAYEAVPAHVPEYWDSRIALGDYLNDLDRPEEAKQVLRELSERYPDRTGALYSLGRLLNNRKQYEEAVDVFSEALERVGEPGPEHWILYYGRGISHERLDTWEVAEADFRRALELSPDHPQVLNYLAYSWVEQGRNFETAREMLERAVEQRPENGYIIDSLGWVQYRMGEYEMAVKTLERALAASPGDPVILDHYGDALWRFGRKVEARFQWQTVLLASDADEELVESVLHKLEEGLPPLDVPASDADL